MPDIVLSPNKLNFDHIDSPTNDRNVSESDNDSVSDSEDDLPTEIDEEPRMHQGNQNNLQSTPGVIQSNSLNENAVKSNITNVTIQNSSNIRFGNETNFHAPVTINRAEINEIFYNKEECKCPIKRIICILVAVIVILLLPTIILILRHQDDGEDDDSIMSE